MTLVILWTSFYHLRFKDNDKSMKHDQIKQTLAKCALLVDEKMNFYTPRTGKSAVRTVLPARTRALVS